MSYNQQLIAAKVDVSTLVKAMQDAATSLGGTSNVFQDEQAEYSESDYAIFSFQEWAVAVRNGMGLNPAFLTAISKHLPIEVIGFDTYEVIGYNHISVLREGVVQMLFTDHDGIHHNEGIDWDAEVARAEKSNEFRFAPGFNKVQTLQHSAYVVLKYHFGFDSSEAYHALEGTKNVTFFSFKFGKKYFESLGETETWKLWGEYLKPT